MDSEEKKERKGEPAKKDSCQNTKKSRANKKQTYIALNSQLEFYFSFSNVSKDRFFAKKLEEDPCK